ncbi:MAG: choice-of-anchor V domain-containing protein [Bacteroidota bacterium]
MIRNTLLLIFFSGIFSIIWTANQTLSYPGGAPSGRTGSPADGKTCVQCHKGIALEKEGWILPGDSLLYKPLHTYTITATSTGVTTSSKFGFQISPQDAEGNLLGILVLTNDNETQLVGKGKYITHTKEGINATGFKSWKFNWIAPAAGTGDVTFYGAFVIGPKPYAVVTSKLILKES